MAKKELAPLRVTCASVDCENGLHSFLRKKGMAPDEEGHCNTCGADLIDWERIHKRRIEDVDFVFESLRNELWRHYMWHLPIPDRVMYLAKRRTFDAVATSARTALKNALTVPRSEQYREGAQTPREDGDNARIYHLGQHATATCCRTCLHRWHGIPLEKRLTDRDLDYCHKLVMRYIEERVGRW